MKDYIFLLLFVLIPRLSHTQQVVSHVDLPQTLLKNSAFKIAYNELYASKLNTIKDDRTKTTEYVTAIQSVQDKIYTSLSTVDNVIINGRYIYYIGQRVPQIFSNLSKASALAVSKPYLVSYYNSTAKLILRRVAGLQNYLHEFVFSNREDILIDQVKRDQFVYQTYRDILTIYNLSAAMVALFQQVNLQQAINNVVPYRWYINADKSIAKGILTRFKF